METDPTRMCELLVGLPEVHILGVDDQVNGFVCIYIESAFSISGLGSAAVQMLGGENPALVLPQVLAIIVLITMVVVVGNLVVDLLYAVLDPRAGIQSGPQRTKSLVGGVF